GRPRAAQQALASRVQTRTGQDRCRRDRYSLVLPSRHLRGLGCVLGALPKHGDKLAGEGAGVNDRGLDVPDLRRIKRGQRPAKRKQGRIGIALVNLCLKGADAVLYELVLDVALCEGLQGGARPGDKLRVRNALTERLLLLTD